LRPLRRITIPENILEKPAARNLLFIPQFSALKLTISRMGKSVNILGSLSRRTNNPSSFYCRKRDNTIKITNNDPAIMPILFKSLIT
jgi:hypothetical protein